MVVQEAPLRYRGQRNQYLDIAARGDERLGVALDYAVHPQTNVGCFILRFVVHGEGIDPKNYNHLTYRESAKFVTYPPNAEVFEGVRLNKIAIPVFKPAVHRREIDQFALKFGVWSALEDWVTAQVTAEGFQPLVDLQKELRRLVVPEPTPEDSVENVLEFPDLSAPEQKALALKQMQKPVSFEDDEDGDGEDDEETIN